MKYNKAIAAFLSAVPTGVLSTLILSYFHVSPEQNTLWTTVIAGVVGAVIVAIAPANQTPTPAAPAPPTGG